MNKVYDELINQLQSSMVTEQFQHLYGTGNDVLEAQKARYQKVLERHQKAFHSTQTVSLISAPGRMEIGGNHTDHNHGLVLAASASLDTLSAVSPREDLQVHLHSEGYPVIELDLSDLTQKPREEGTTTALIRGVASRMAELGYKIGGFDATVQSTVVAGSGLSSSAAFEVMTVAILDHLYNRGDMDFKQMAMISQFSENRYFGKPSGLLDQMASAAGGLVNVDFGTQEPVVTPMHFDFADQGYQIVVVNTHGSHADLTPDYASIPREMKAIAAYFGKEVLREVAQSDFERAIPALRKKVSDRAVLRALHFFSENERVIQETNALQNNDIQSFFEGIIESGRSSFMYLQNVYAKPDQQGLSIALALAEKQLKGHGAWRVHGGGFAGTTLNFVPDDLVKAFTDEMNRVFGIGSCFVLKIRPQGAVKLQVNP